MAVEVIEGTLAPAQPDSRKRGYGRYKQLHFTAASGSQRTVKKVAAGPALVDEIARGGPGRYFVASADGAKAVCGVRRPDGSSQYAHWSNIEPIILVVGLIGLAVAVARLGFGVEDAPLTPAVLGPLLLLCWLYLRNQRLAAKSAFDRG